MHHFYELVNLDAKALADLMCVSVIQIHHELAKYHEVGRFADKGQQPDMSAAMFHEQFAADLGVKEAMVTLASIYFGLTHEVLVNVTLEVRTF